MGNERARGTGGESKKITTKRLELRVANLDCEHDAAAIERGVRGEGGVVNLKVYPKSAKVALMSGNYLKWSY